MDVGKYTNCSGGVHNMSLVFGMSQFEIPSRSPAWLTEVFLGVCVTPGK
jgi:hypothetical protein